MPDSCELCPDWCCEDVDVELGDGERHSVHSVLTRHTAVPTLGGLSVYVVATTADPSTAVVMTVLETAEGGEPVVAAMPLLEALDGTTHLLAGVPGLPRPRRRARRASSRCRTSGGTRQAPDTPGGE